ncbi:MAG: hypothetical protein E4H03_02350 [Myxococcales bacterium]|nr:MAG: hypothetical protein E4H03_02350 [Myxococcales bacterium]
MIGHPRFATARVAALLCTFLPFVLAGCTTRSPERPRAAAATTTGTEATTVTNSTSASPASLAQRAPASRDWIAAEEIVGAELPETNPAFANWPVRPLVDYRALQILDSVPMEIVASRRSGGGTTGAERMDILLPTVGHECRLKAKKFPSDLDGFNNSPRKEIAAYMIQRILFEPEEYVVPTTLARCVPTDVWEPYHPGDGPTLDGTRCVLVITALWLQDVELPGVLLDEARFASDTVYARHRSDFNVFTYVVGHRDGRTGNFLVPQDDNHPHVFAVDNGIAFNPWVYNYFVPNWHKLRVPAVRRETVERLRALEREDLDFLFVAAQLETDDDGVMHMQTPIEVDDPDNGATFVGNRLQLGLTRKEIDQTWRRIERLLEMTGSGKIGTF